MSESKKTIEVVSAIIIKDGKIFATLNFISRCIVTFAQLSADSSRSSNMKMHDGWEINGVVFNSHKDVYERMHEHKTQLVVSYERAYPLFMERTKGKRLAFFENTNQLKDWLKMVSPELDMTEVCHRLPSGSQVAFISKKAGIVFAPGFVHAIKCKSNPYYGKCDARTLQSETIDAVINIKTTHPELLNYLLENNMLQDGDLSNSFPSELGKEIFTRNIDFIARNHRRHHYHDHDY